MIEERNNKRYIMYIGGIFSTLKFDSDVVDIPSRQPCVTYLDVFFLVCSIIMHLIDMAFDINIAVRYLLANKVIYFIWTLVFLLIPSFINVIISRRMQHQDEKTESDLGQLENHKSCTQVMIKKKIYCVLAVAFQLAPVIRYYDTLIYALKARKCEKVGDRNGQRRYYLKMLKEDQDVALLRIFECFLEAAPQQVLQLTILLKHYNRDINLEFIHQVCSIVSSLVSMGWAMASYNRTIRLAQHDKEIMNIRGSICQFFWHFLVTVSRILIVSLIASIWPLYTGIACICHWIAMTIWILIDSHGILQFCRKNNRAPHMTPTITERFYSVLLALVIGLLHIFVYLNVIDGNTLLKHSFFYSLCFLENVIANLLWMFNFSIEAKHSWYFFLYIVPSTVPFILGITAMILYYTLYHPVRKSQPQSNLNNED
ncbi:XK-related protein 6-like [Vespa velutina]|uniref:XK-related protein 6-like n=1 Tax=Vespa velutina TaxID=202808 RepID=UPI001FB1D0A2|nr:XK-related protein 6-like [Vespa velutina]XP_047354550.1 XK-related protein 6-like [Vespa velutina]XP_047354551.1 XK-related protein 6-like [Vespa velutina]XP_047354552.1 XK-related protein 6-like [Vespa velutina]XP_047354553.1 XK-related protein 6-like [Vespa velutina]XP_047354555.1 XK-related protein 6-like [Vespa velutina]XP_047354556.1 XK-related protein 6-like [Vespa velutina]